MVRELDTETLERAAKDYAIWFIKDEGKFDRAWVAKQFYNFTYKDEFLYMVNAIKNHLGPSAIADLDARLAEFPVRSDEVFHQLLELKRPRGYTPKGG